MSAASEWNLALDVAPQWLSWNRDSPYYSAPYMREGRTLRADLDIRFRDGGWNARGALRDSAAQGQAPARKGVLEEAYYDGDLSPGYGYSLGKKVLSWGVGFGFRPLDVVQREDRRAINPPPLVGQPVLAWERYGDQDALSLVWVRPGSGGGVSDDRASSLAAHWYRLSGGVDWHGVARLSERHGLEAGMGGAWTAGEEWAFHGAALFETRHPSRVHTLAESGGVLAFSDPLVEIRAGGAWRGVMGAQWTGVSGFGVLLEAWHDGEAWRRDEWQNLADLTARQRALTGSVHLAALEGNIAWSAQAFVTPNLLRNNLLARLSWQEERRWSAWLETLVTPEDGGRVLSTGLAFTGDRQSLSGGLRVFGGSASSAYAQAPLGRLAWLEWRLAFK